MKEESKASKFSIDRKITDEYIVGLIDGEGTISITRYPDGRERPQVLIFSTFKEVLEKIKKQKSLTGPVMKVSRVGDNLNREKDCYRLQMRSREDIRKMFDLLREHPPIIKRKEFKDVYQETRDWVYD